MRLKLQIRIACRTLLVAALMVLLNGPAITMGKMEELERFSARIRPGGQGGEKRLDIVIYEWTTPEERQALRQAFNNGGSPALRTALSGQAEKGRLELPEASGISYPTLQRMRYAWQTEAAGEHRIVLATDRPMGFLESGNSTDDTFGLVILELDSRTGEGQGTVISGAGLSVDRRTGRFTIEHAGTQPIKLTGVKRVR